MKPRLQAEGHDKIVGREGTESGVLCNQYNCSVRPINIKSDL